MDRPEPAWCMSAVDIFADLTEAELATIARAAPPKAYPVGSLIYTPHQPVETLFILKKGRIRLFRVSPDGRALTTAIVNPGTIFGEMVLLGQQMHDSYAEALDDVTTCVMTRAGVQRHLLSDSRIAARISETLGRRIGALEQRLSDTVFKSVPERIAGTLTLLGEQHTGLTHRGQRQVRLTHEQLAALTGTSRETATKVLGELADRGLISLGRGRVTILDEDALQVLADAGP